MRWDKLGLVYKVDGSVDWMKTHAMLPTPLLLDDRIRVYFCSRDSQGICRITFVDLERGNPLTILHAENRPLFPIGRPGTFDDSGTLCTSAVRVENKVFMYFTGYSRRVAVPYSNAIGLAISEDNGATFEKPFEGPVVDRNQWEPYFAVAANTIKEGDKWHMWYSSGTGWIDIDGKPESLYHIKYASSSDGVQWNRENISCIKPSNPQESIARAGILRERDSWRMWYSFRGSHDFRDGADSYKIGYAEARDPINWTRKDELAGIAPSKDGWDSSMLAYPAVLQVGPDTYLFYNGNGFGASGFGVAVLR